MIGAAGEAASEAAGDAAGDAAGAASAREYWNHNVLYHPAIVRAARQHVGERSGEHGGKPSGTHALDVGCGDGLLVSKLAPHFTTVLGIDTDASAVERAAARFIPGAAGAADANDTNAPRRTQVRHADFLTADLYDATFDFITFVAVIHHLDLESALERAGALLRPGGELFIVGLAANASVFDWVLSGLQLPIVRLSDLLHRARSRSGPPMVVANPTVGLRRIRAVAGRILPGARLRRKLHYRYVLRWTKPLP